MRTLTRSKRAALSAAGVVAAGSLGAGLITAPAAADTAGNDSTTADTPVDRPDLDDSLAALHDAGMTGAFAAHRDEQGVWQGAAGVADVETGAPTTADMRHRVGSVTKTFTAVALLQESGEGTLDLDAPVAEYLPGVLPDDLSEVTPRMLLNHTSGIEDYVVPAFPSLVFGSGRSLEEHRHRSIERAELVDLGLSMPRTGEPGETHSYSNTNYVLAGMVLEAVTGTDPAQHITEQVIEPAGLTDTGFPDAPVIDGPHPAMYESLYGEFDPPRDFSEYDMSWAAEAGALVSTMADLNDFHAALFGGELLDQEQLDEMLETVPVEMDGAVVGEYGLGIVPMSLSCDVFWGHDGLVFGAGTLALSSEDGTQQTAVAHNLTKYQEINDEGWIDPHPADEANYLHFEQALCGGVTPERPTEDDVTDVPPLTGELTPMPQTVRVP